MTKDVEIICPDCGKKFVEKDKGEKTFLIPLHINIEKGGECQKSYISISREHVREF